MREILILCLIIGASHGQMPTPNHPEMALVGVNYKLELNHQMFFNSSFKESKYGVRYVVSTLGRPDLPAWLRVVQEQITEPAFLYGTPDSIDDTTTVEITAIDRNTNAVSQMTRNIKVTQLSDQARYFVELTIRNLNLGEIFSRDLLNDILVRMRRIWPSSGNIYITKVATLAEVGERLPVPKTPAAANALKDGVRIRVGGTGDFSNPLKDVELDTRKACGSSQAQPYVSINDRFVPVFDIDWCKYRLAEIGVPSRVPSCYFLSLDMEW